VNCPVCDAKLREVEKHGVEVDICPDCKGIWLDRGELDKILQMTRNGGPISDVETRRVPDARWDVDESQHDHPRYRKRDGHHEQYSSRRERRGSWLAEIFESFGGDD
jgi:Zn-finger nucleic acid-binding protein